MAIGFTGLANLLRLPTGRLVGKHAMASHFRVHRPPPLMERRSLDLTHFEQGRGH